MISDVIHREGQQFKPLNRSLRNMRLNDARELAERAAKAQYEHGIAAFNPFNGSDPEEAKLAVVWDVSFDYMLADLRPEEN